MKQWKNMESQNTKALLQKYWNGLSTLEEERLLTAHFEGDIPADVKAYEAIFAYRNHIQSLEADEFDLSFLGEAPVHTIRSKPAQRRINTLMVMGRVAAVAMFIAICSVGYQWPKTQSLQQQSEAMEVAYEETLMALAMISEKLNRGHESIGELKVFDQTVNHIIHEN